MGGGEGCGALSNIVNALYYELTSQGIDANILVVCGRNQKLKNDFDTRDWNQLMARFRAKRNNSENDLCGKNKNGIISNAMSYTDITDQCLAFPAPKTLRRVLSGQYNICMTLPNNVPDTNQEEKQSWTTKSVEVGIGLNVDRNDNDSYHILSFF